MKLNALILLLSGVLNSVATILFGKEENRIMEEKDEQRTLVYVALKTLRNAETYAQVLDAIGSFSEAMDFVEEKHEDVAEKLHDNETYITELKADRKNLREELTRSQAEIAKLRKEKHHLRQHHLLASNKLERERDEARQTSRKLNEIITSHEIGEHVIKRD